MEQITWEAAKDTQSQIWVMFIYKALCHVTTVCMDGRSRPLPSPFHGKQTAICGILLWVSPRMTTDLYSGTLRRRPVAMVPRVADAENGVKAGCSESSHFDNRLSRVDFDLSDPFLVTVVVVQKNAGKSLSDSIELSNASTVAASLMAPTRCMVGFCHIYGAFSQSCLCCFLH